MEMNLIVCPSRLFAVYLLAYIDQEGVTSEFEIVIPGLEKIPTELIQIAGSLNSRFILESEMYDKRYEEVLVHSYFKFNAQQEFISKLHFNTLALFADGIRNGLYGLPSINKKVKKIVFFGFKVIDESFSRSMRQSGLNVQIKIVSWERIGSIWRMLFKLNTDSSIDNFNPNDFLLTMRYWGVDSHQYKFSAHSSVVDYMSKELSNVREFERLIFRPHPWFRNDIEKEELRVIFGPQVKIEFWDEIFKPNPDFPELSEPEAIFWNLKTSPKYFFGFDSSLNILVNQEHPSTNIIWPKEDLYSKFFERPRSTEIVREQVDLMRSIALLDLRLNEFDSGVSIDGSAMEAALTQMVFEGWERSLTQERDALTQERDALKNSTIWRLTEPLRKFRNIQKN